MERNVEIEKLCKRLTDCGVDELLRRKMKEREGGVE